MDPARPDDQSLRQLIAASGQRSNIAR